MTGVSWGNYQDYLYGRFDGKKHVDEAQTDRWGNVISHGGDVYYMCPGPTFGDYPCPERAGGASTQARRRSTWKSRSSGRVPVMARASSAPGGPPTARTGSRPTTSPDAQYRASLLKYDLYRQALKQVFDAVQADNHEDRTTDQVLRGHA